jgi:hypothetical protein
MNRDQKFENMKNAKNAPMWKIMREYLVEDKEGKQKTIWTTMTNKQSLIDQGYKIVRQ